MNPWETLKRDVLEARLALCETKRAFPHHCQGGFELHHIMITRNHTTGNPPAQRYAMHDINVALLCSRAHGLMGRDPAVRAWLVQRAVSRHGEWAVREYLAQAPLKHHFTLESLLLGP